MSAGEWLLGHDRPRKNGRVRWTLKSFQTGEVVGSRMGGPDELAFVEDGRIKLEKCKQIEKCHP